MYITKSLSKFGIRVIGEAENGRVALEKYKLLLPDIVTMDVIMNVMNGIEALSEIVTYNPLAVVIMVSSMGQSDIVNAAIKMGAKGFFIKPLQEKQIESVIRRLNQNNKKN
ncbi:MAG: response regulator [Defluviitaleaceae bacterium]|nr:response regulator [Defluviitaleaceae bacterium]